MAEERVFTRPLVCFLALVAALLLRGLDDRYGQLTAAEAVQRLVDGDHERQERERLLRALQTLAAGTSERAAMLRAAMASVALDDEMGYRTWARALGGALPLRAEDVEDVDTAALGDPVLAALLQAMLAEVRGQPDAGARYAQVEASSRLFHMLLAQRLAAAGRERLR